MRLPFSAALVALVALFGLADSAFAQHHHRQRILAPFTPTATIVVPVATYAPPVTVLNATVATTCAQPSADVPLKAPATAIAPSSAILQEVSVAPSYGVYASAALTLLHAASPTFAIPVDHVRRQILRRDFLRRAAARTPVRNLVRRIVRR